MYKKKKNDRALRIRHVNGILAGVMQSLFIMQDVASDDHICDLFKAWVITCKVTFGPNTDMSEATDVLGNQLAAIHRDEPQFFDRLTLALERGNALPVGFFNPGLN